MFWGPLLVGVCSYHAWMSIEAECVGWLQQRGWRLVEFDGDAGLWGFTSQATRTVGLHRSLRASQRAATLLHELEHVRRGDEGHQPPAVERFIDETVAARLVDRDAYAFWEGELGWSTGGIAAELGVPRWVVSAYRRLATRGRVS